MEVKVTTSKRDELRRFWRKHKKGLAIAGTLVACAGGYAVWHGKPKLSEEQLKGFEEFIEKVLRPATGAKQAYTEYGSTGEVIAKVSELGRLGESMVASMGSFTPDTEVVGVVVYTK